MKRIVRYTMFLLLSGLFLAACQDPLTLGIDLLDSDQARVGFTDTIAVRAVTRPGDSVVTYAPTRANQLTSYLFGDFRDSYFGRTESSIYAQVRPERLAPDFSNSRLDSVVLVLPYDTAGVYGRIDSPFGMEISRVMEDMDRTQVYYSTQTFATDPAPVGVGDFVPTLDSISVIEYLSPTLRDTIRYPHLRVHLDSKFGEELLQIDTAFLQSDSAFLSYLPGIYLRPTQATQGLLSFALNTSPFRGGIYLYYTQNDTTLRQFQFAVDDFSTRLTHYEHDYTGAPVEAIIGVEAAGDSILAVQGMAGLNVDLELQDIEKYEGLIVNKAELEISLRSLEGDDEEAFTPVDQFLLSVRDTSGTLVIISDVAITSRLGILASAFGGVLNTETRTYAMNLSSYFQEVLDGSQPPKLTLTVFPKAQTPQRAGLFGARDPAKGIKVRLAFTQL